MPAWLDQLLVLAAILAALAYFWLGARSRRHTAAHGTGSAPPCAGGCCTPKLPPHLKPRR